VEILNCVILKTFGHDCSVHGALVSRCRSEYCKGSWLVMAVQQSDALVIEAVSQSLGPGSDAPIQSVC
jgi:hypothetical protein